MWDSCDTRNICRVWRETCITDSIMTSMSKTSNVNWGSRYKEYDSLDTIYFRVHPIEYNKQFRLLKVVTSAGLTVVWPICAAKWCRLAGSSSARREGGGAGLWANQAFHAMNITCPLHISLMLLPGRHTFIIHTPASTTRGVQVGGETAYTCS